MPQQYPLYIGSYAASEKPGVYAFAFDGETGELTERSSVAGIANPSYIAVHPSGRWLYAVSETSGAQEGAPGAVWALAIGREPWSIEPINSQPSGGDWPCHLAIDESGRWLVVSNYASGSVSVLPILIDGSLGESAGIVQHSGSGPNRERQGGPHAHSALFTPDDRFVVVADLGIDALLVYAFDLAAGALLVHSQVSARPGAGPRHMAFHPDGRHLYAANELDNTVVMYSYDPDEGVLSERQLVDTLPPGAPENTVADIHISPHGDRLYVSNRGHESIAVFDVGLDALLTLVATPSCGGRWPRNFAIAPGGKFMLVANQYSDQVSVLPLLAGAAGLGEPVSQVAIPGASCIQFLPEGMR